MTNPKLQLETVIKELEQVLDNICSLNTEVEDRYHSLEAAVNVAKAWKILTCLLNQKTKKTQSIIND